MLAVFAQSPLFSGSLLNVVGGGVFSVLLIVACVTDMRWRRIPNVLVLVLAISGLAFSVYLDPWSPGLVRGASGLALGFAIWIAFYALGAIGAGDVKLFAAAGAWLGPAFTWRAALVAAAVGGVLAVAALLRERRTREGFEKVFVSLNTRSVAPLALDPNVPRKRQLPYGVALSLGALIVAWIPGVLR